MMPEHYLRTEKFENMALVEKRELGLLEMLAKFQRNEIVFVGKGLFKMFVSVSWQIFDHQVCHRRREI